MADENTPQEIEVAPEPIEAEVVQPWDAVRGELDSAGLDLGDNPVDTIREYRDQAGRIEEMERTLGYQQQAIAASQAQAQELASRHQPAQEAEEKPWYSDVWQSPATKDFSPWIHENEFIPQTPKEVRDDFERIQKFSDNLRSNPPETMWGMVQPQVESTIARMIDQQVSQRESGQVLNRFEQENQDWLYEADPRSSEGNFVAAINPVNNQRVPSQYGQAMANFFNQAKSSGVQDDQQALGMAKQMLASQISQQQAYSSNGELEHLRAEVAEMREKQEAAAMGYKSSDFSKNQRLRSTPRTTSSERQRIVRHVTCPVPEPGVVPPATVQLTTRKVLVKTPWL